jgi:methylglutaconyl-CoA hydratase
MSESVLDIRRPSPHVAEVWLNRPEVRNAFNDGVIAALTEAFRTLNQDTELRVVVLGGHGKAFCAGADLNWMRAMADYTWAQNRADASKLAEMLWTCGPVPGAGGRPHARRLLRRRHGAGRGVRRAGGAEGVHFCLSEAKLGLLPATIAPYVVRAMGEQAARRYFTTAERFSAAQAQAHGFRARAVHAGRAGRPRGRSLVASAGGQRPGGGARPASSWCATWPAVRSTPRCATRPRAASPTSAPAPKGAKACRRS